MMTTNKLLQHTHHRPWDLSNKKWQYYQEWNKAVFLHWEVEVSELRKFVPKELEIDLFEHKAYVSLVSFKMEKIRPRLLPAFPPISNFGEINIRTYVKYKGKTGVYFLSIEGGKWLSCKLAKAMSELPYRYSKMKQKSQCHESKNDNFSDRFTIDFEIGEKVFNKTPLDLWLTERYVLFQNGKNGINAFEIHHLEWPVQQLNINTLEVDYKRFSSLLNNTPVKVHYSKGVQVIAWGKEIY